MASSTGPNLGIEHSWTYRESGWKDAMDDTLILVDSLLMLGVVSNVVTAPPGSPTDGDRYIIPSGATGDWAGKTGQVAAWLDSEAVWTYYVPNAGWLSWVAADTTLYVYNGTVWSAIAGGSVSLPAGTWNDPFIFGSGAAYQWVDATNSLMRIKFSAAPSSETDGMIVLTG